MVSGARFPLFQTFSVDYGHNERTLIHSSPGILSGGVLVYHNRRNTVLPGIEIVLLSDLETLRG